MAVKGSRRFGKHRAAIVTDSWAVYF